MSRSSVVNGGSDAASRANCMSIGEEVVVENEKQRAWEEGDETPKWGGGAAKRDIVRRA